MTFDLDMFTYAQYAISEDDNVDVDRLHVVFAVLVLLEAAVVDKVVILEKLDLFSGFLHE